MRTVVGVANLDEVVSRSLARARRRSEGEIVRPKRHILFEHAEDRVTLMTPHRIRLYSEVKERALSVTDLARALDRDRSAVSRDVKALQELRLIKLTKITVPTLVLVGDHDPQDPERQQREELLPLLGEAKLDLLSDCGHLAPIEQPELLAEAVGVWLRGLNPS